MLTTACQTCTADGSSEQPFADACPAAWCHEMLVAGRPIEIVRPAGGHAAGAGYESAPVRAASAQVNAWLLAGIQCFLVAPVTLPPLPEGLVYIVTAGVRPCGGFEVVASASPQPPHAGTLGTETRSGQ